MAVVEDGAESLGSLYKGEGVAVGAYRVLQFQREQDSHYRRGRSHPHKRREASQGGPISTTQAKEDGIGYIHPAVGYNYRMNNVLAALGLAQLETIEERLV